MRLGLYPIVLAEGTRRLAALRAGDHPGAPPPPLRGQQRLPARSSRSTGCACRGIWAEKQLVEIIELRRASVLRRRPVPSRVPLAAVGSASALRRLRRRPPSSTARAHDATSRPREVVASAAITIGGGAPLALIGGPCAIENEKHALMTAERLADHRRRARGAVHLQVVLRQGQPLVGQQLPRPGAASRACAS